MNTDEQREKRRVQQKRRRQRQRELLAADRKEHQQRLITAFLSTSVAAARKSLIEHLEIPQEDLYPPMGIPRFGEHLNQAYLWATIDELHRQGKIANEHFRINRFPDIPPGYYLLAVNPRPVTFRLNLFEATRFTHGADFLRALGGIRANRTFDGRQLKAWLFRIPFGPFAPQIPSVLRLCTRLYEQLPLITMGRQPLG